MARALIVAGCLWAGAAWADVVFEPPTWSPDKPLLPATGASGQVKLVNRGAHSAQLGALRYHGAAYARTGAKELGPGEAAKVNVWVNASAAYGPIEGRIEVPVDGQPAATLRVSAVVGHASDVGLLPREIGTGRYPARAGRPLLVRFYYQSGCEHCAAVMREVVEPLARYFGAATKFDIGTLGDMNAYVQLQQLKDAYRVTKPALTYAFVGSHALADLTVNDDLYRLILAELEHPTPAPPLPPPGTVSAQQVHQQLARLGPLAAMGLGAVDGLNPCAFATIVFLIALLTRLGHRRRTLAAAGLGYAAAVFVTYTLLGLGVLRALAHVDQQLAAARALRLVVALWAAFFGVLQVRDVLRLRAGAPTRDLTAQLPTRLKQYAHALLRWSTSPRWGWLVVGLATAAAGVAVTLIEMACTSQVYVPVLMLLRSEGWQARAGRLLLSYNLGFVLPLLAVTGLAIGGVGSAALAGFARRHLAGCKLALAAMLIGLAVLLASA